MAIPELRDPKKMAASSEPLAAAAVGPRRRTRLAHAAARGDLAGLRGWLAHGARVDAVNINGWMPLHYAAAAGHAAAVELLAARGAPVGAVATVNATKVANVVEAVTEITQGGAHVSVDALGHPTTCFNSISNFIRPFG